MAITSRQCQAPNCENPRDLKQGSSLCVMHRIRRSRYNSFNLPSQEAIESNESFSSINRSTKAEGKVCSISNCKTRVYKHGKICSKHQWRRKKFGSYDLPNYSGEPNYLVVDKLPEGVVKICDIHGDLTEEQTYKRYHKEKISSHYCTKCAKSKNIKLNYRGLNGIEDYESMVSDQLGLCAICKNPESMTSRNGKSIKSLAIDHCHESKIVRGLLCAACNSMIGYAKDNIATLESAIAYLKRHA